MTDVSKGMDRENLLLLSGMINGQAEFLRSIGEIVDSDPVKTKNSIALCGVHLSALSEFLVTGNWDAIMDRIAEQLRL